MRVPVPGLQDGEATGAGSQELFDDAVIGEEPFRLLEQDGVAELGQVDTVARQTSWFAGEVLRGGRVVARAQRSWP